MACPFFEPLERWQQAASRMPLGDLWRGVCRAEAALFTPGDSASAELCNMGYARGRCARFPHTDARDAARFLVAHDHDGLIRIDYVVEHDHHPHSHGSLEYSPALGGFASAEPNTVLSRQALAYVESYLRRRPAAA